MNDVRENERDARVALGQLFEPGHEKLGALVAELGPVAVLNALECADTLDLDRADALRLRMDETRPADAIAAGAAAGARLVVPGDKEWPSTLDVLGSQTPLALWVRGSASLADAVDRAVAVVGARASTGYGEHVAGDLGYGLASKGWTVVSGGAYGIDSAAHRGALTAGGQTVAVLACGVDVPYPRGHSSLFERIVSDGAVVSEWPPGTPPARHRFLVRNRVIAAMTAGTVVVEAAARSGALNTAGWATRIGRTLMAVPGPVTSSMSVGCHELLRREGVRCVTGLDHVLEEVGRIGFDLAAPPRGPQTALDELDEQTRRVYEGIPARRAAGPAEIARAAGVAAVEALGCLTALEIDGLAVRTEAGWRLAARPRPRMSPHGVVG